MARFLKTEKFKRLVKAGKIRIGEKDAEQILLKRDAEQVRVEAIDEANRTATYVITDATVDRARDSLLPAGGQMKNYAANPVFLWAHDYSLEPIGKCIKGPWLENEQWKATFQYLTEDVNPQAERVWKQVVAGVLRAVSIGFIPVKYVFNDERGGYAMDFLEWELMEVSQVPVPCNPSATLADGKAIDDLEAFVKGLRDHSATRAAADDEEDDDETESADDLHEKMAGHVKTLGEHCAVMGDHAKAMADMRKEYAKTLSEAQAHAKALGDCAKAIADAMGSDDDDDEKSAPEAVTKGGAPHKLSKATEKELAKIEKAAANMRALHNGEQPPTDTNEEQQDPNGDDDGEKAAPLHPLDAWMLEVAKAGHDPKEVMAQAARRAAAVETGRLDEG